jgi:hypothetical protein
MMRRTFPHFLRSPLNLPRPPLPRQFWRQESSRPNIDISGIFPPIITPFDGNGGISYEKLKTNFGIWNEIPFKGT